MHHNYGQTYKQHEFDIEETLFELGIARKGR